MTDLRTHGALLLGILMSFVLHAQHSWHSPVAHTTRLSGTYCELRGAHFHHGIDIKSSRGTVGDPIYSVGDGYICRIKIAHGGYGQALYIRHPQGVMTVYAHLHALAPAVAKRVLEEQRSATSYEIDIELAPDELPVVAGEQIGTMGNTGYSFGPHLHFELRDSAGEVTLNPMHLGIDILDQVKPTMSHLRWHQMTADGVELDQGQRAFASEQVIKQAPGRYALSVRAFDRMSNTPNRNGVERLTLECDGQTIYQYHADTVSFEHDRVADMLKTTAERDGSRYWYRLHTLPCAEDEEVLKTKGRGWLGLAVGDTVRCAVEAEDWTANVTSGSVTLVGVPNGAPSSVGTRRHYLLPCDQPNVIEYGDVRLFFEADGFFRDQWLELDTIHDVEHAGYGPMYCLGGDYLGYQAAGRISFDISAYDRDVQDRFVIVKCQDDKTVVGGTRDGARLHASISSHGCYTLHLDTVSPQVRPLICPSVMRNGQQIVLSMEDDIEPKGYAKDVVFDARIDGQWIPMRYDLTKYRLVYTVTDLTPGQHELEIQYEDHAGNQGTWTHSFSIKS